MDNYMITTENLTGGEKVSLASIEITSVPHFSIIDDKAFSSAEVTDKYKAEFLSLLNEIYQVYRTESFSAGIQKDVSIELLWKTTSVSNQPYNADIRLFIVVRSIDCNASLGQERVAKIVRLFCSALSYEKYDFKHIEYSELKSIISEINDSSISAIVKEEKLENLQNQLLPYCYSYDKIPTSEDDLSRIVNALIYYPDCAVSVQLIPTSFEANESAEIDRVTQILDTLSKGIMDQGIGNISFTLAEKHAENYRYYSSHKAKPLFTYNVLVFGDGSACNNISSRVYGQLSSSSDDTANLKIVSLNSKDVAKDNNFYPLPWAVSEVLQGTDRNSQIWNSGQFSVALYRMPFIITADEAVEFFRLPIGNERISAGLNINESGKGNKTYTSNIINSGDITVGKLRSSSKGDTIGFSLKDLAKHMLVVGTPGSGKTTFSVSLLDRLWREHKIPFLVIEPAKNEYRALVQSIPDLQVFTPGKNFISPFVFNPFVPPKNVKLETYKSTLKTAFSAAVSMSTPLDKIFEEAINNCYSDFRWLDTYTIDDKGKIFNISDFIKCFQQTFDEIGYTGDARNIGRAGVVRLNSLVNLFDNYFSIPIEDILKKPTIIELAAIENSDQKALIIALLLLSILAYVNANYVGEGGLKNVILLEEAHVLLDADTNAGQGEANPSAIAQGLVKRMLAEIRSYGVGIVIADQSPRKVSTDVVALTDMKMVFRLVESADKQIIGDSTNMSEVQNQRMSKLKPGEAFLFFNKLDEPEEVITPDYRLENKITSSNIYHQPTNWEDVADSLMVESTTTYETPIAEGQDDSPIAEDEISQNDVFDDNIDYDGISADIESDALSEGFKDINIDQDSERLNSSLVNFDSNNWENLSLSEQKESMGNLADYVSDVLSLENPPTIEYYNNPVDGDYGGYNPATNSLQINEHMLYDSDEAADTIAHELWHAHQHECASNPQNALHYQYQHGFDNYISPDLDPVGYQNQLVEAEARAFAEQFKDRLNSLKGGQH